MIIPSCSEENDDFIIFTFFSNSSHLEFLIRLNFFFSEALESDHAAHEISDSWKQWFKRISGSDRL